MWGVGNGRQENGSVRQEKWSDRGGETGGQSGSDGVECPGRKRDLGDGQDWGGNWVEGHSNSANGERNPNLMLAFAATGIR